MVWFPFSVIRDKIFLRLYFLWCFLLSLVKTLSDILFDLWQLQGHKRVGGWHLYGSVWKALNQQTREIVWLIIPFNLRSKWSLCSLVVDEVIGASTPLCKRSVNNLWKHPHCQFMQMCDRGVKHVIMLSDYYMLNTLRWGLVYCFSKAIRVLQTISLSCMLV